MSEQNHVVTKDNEMSTNKVEQAMQRMDGGKKDEIMHSFESFKQYLSKRIQMAQSIGLDEEQIAKTAEKVADYLASHEEPRNREEKLLQELWKVGRQEERHKLAHMLVRMTQQTHG